MDEDLIDSLSRYHDAALALIDRAEGSIAICDRDLSQLPLESPTGVKALGAFLLRSSQPDCLRFVLHDPAHLQKHCPRLVRLLADYAHRAEVRHSAREHRHLEPCFIIADEAHQLIRFHHDLPRARLSFDAPGDATESLLRFDTLWERGRPLSLERSLGL